MRPNLTIRCYLPYLQGFWFWQIKHGGADKRGNPAVHESSRTGVESTNQPEQQVQHFRHQRPVDYNDGKEIQFGKVLLFSLDRFLQDNFTVIWLKSLYCKSSKLKDFIFTVKFFTKTRLNLGSDSPSQDFKPHQVDTLWHIYFILFQVRSCLKGMLWTFSPHSNLSFKCNLTKYDWRYLSKTKFIIHIFLLKIISLEQDDPELKDIVRKVSELTSQSSNTSIIQIFPFLRHVAPELTG